MEQRNRNFFRVSQIKHFTNDATYGIIDDTLVSAGDTLIMTINELTRKLNRVKRNQNGFYAQCPAHDDKKQSLSIAQADGKLLLKCFAGCPTERIVSELGIEWKDLFSESSAGQLKQTFSSNDVTYFASRTSKIDTVYRYTDETGNLLYENVRYRPKGFRQRRFDLDGKEIWNLQGVRRVPYRLKQLVENVRPGSDVWLCEGEKDADALAELGFVTTNFKGWQREFNKYIDKANVIFVQDHDEPGQLHAQISAQMIAPVAESVKIIDLFADRELPQKHGPDISDFIRVAVQDEGLSREEIAERLATIADGANAWIDTSSPDGKSLFLIKTGNRWIEEAGVRPSPKMLFGEFWFQGELCILFADTNVGKSILAVQIGDAVSRGGFDKCPNRAESRIPLPVIEVPPQRVVYFDFELTDKQFEARIAEREPGAEFYTNHYKFSENFLRAELNPDVSDLQGFTKFEEFLNHSLNKAIVDYKADVLIVDNLTYLRDETENARNALPLMKYLKELKQKHGLSILALAHTPKRDSSKPLGRNDLQGSKMLINFCDSSFAIGESQKELGLRYLKQIKSRNAAITYHGENVLLTNIVKERNFLQFCFNGHGQERLHLRVPSEGERDGKVALAKQLAAEGLTQRAIADKLEIPLTTINRYLKME